MFWFWFIGVLRVHAAVKDTHIRAANLGHSDPIAQSDVAVAIAEQALVQTNDKARMPC